MWDYFAFPVFVRARDGFKRGFDQPSIHALIEEHMIEGLSVVVNLKQQFNNLKPNVCPQCT